MIIVQIAVELIVKLFRVERCVGDAPVPVLVVFGRSFLPGEVHELRFADRREPEILAERFHEGTGGLSAELPRQPVTKMLPRVAHIDRLDVPRHIHHQVELIGRDIGIVHYRHPETVGSLAPGCLQLVGDEAGLRRAEPKVAVRPSGISEVIDGTAVAAVVNGSDIAIIVVGPSDVDRQAFLHSLQA